MNVDRLEEIKERYTIKEGYGPFIYTAHHPETIDEDMEWLIGEVERLAKVSNTHAAEEWRQRRHRKWALEKAKGLCAGIKHFREADRIWRGNHRRQLQRAEKAEAEVSEVERENRLLHAELAEWKSIADLEKNRAERAEAEWEAWEMKARDMAGELAQARERIRGLESKPVIPDSKNWLKEPPPPWRQIARAMIAYVQATEPGGEG